MVSDEADLFHDGGVKILGALMQAPATAYQLALRLALAPAEVQVVIDRFLERGLVHEVDAFAPGEKHDPYYTTEVRDLILALGNEDDRQRRLQVARFVLDSLQTHLIESLTHLGPEQLALLKLSQVSMTTCRARRFRDRLSSLMEEFGMAEMEESSESYALMVALYPLIDPDRA